jgi:concanavalin A-like lectin/glucanase superfamily protein
MSGLDGFVKLLLHCDGSDGSTTFTDASDQGHTVTANGDAQVDTAQKKFGTGSALFDGTGDSLQIADSDDWHIWDDDATVDLWVNFNTLPGDSEIREIISQHADSNNFWSIYISQAEGLYILNLQVAIGGTSRAVYEAVSLLIDLPGWHHLAVERHGDTANIYVDGDALSVFEEDAWGAITNISGPLYISPTPFGIPMDGWVDEVRISKGVARYKGQDFTPQSLAYSLTTPDHWFKPLETPPPPRESVKPASRPTIFYEPDIAAISLAAFKGWFTPLSEPFPIPRRLQTGIQLAYIDTLRAIIRRRISLGASHQGTVYLHGRHRPDAEIDVKVKS